MREEQFESYLQDDLSWRKKEISDLLLLAQVSEQQEILLKSLILVLYSHWEGYVKKGSKLYLKYVSEKKVKIKDLTVNFKGIQLKSLSKACIEGQESISLAKEIDFINRYSSVENIKFKLSINPDDDREVCIVETGHNLSPKVMKNIFNLIGLKYCQPIESREQYLNSNLLNNRNAIGHGSKIPEDSYHDFDLNLSEVLKLKEIIIAILDYFQESLLYYQENKLYLEGNLELKNTYNHQRTLTLQRKLDDIETRDN
ncbi:MAE_28990/MAE_18760 family HEPN-like nuclease [Rummeliibacillus stabekisii]|uniref:MAE_28990/MAE_18760 family HEPN-like nuclease n=1 Tax=Rummeliibacillus stabekisii TaxID=241244 RepID=UPI002040ADF6|nr:MAE_28990/MAE_18760 family HEPN-like nuclease [Rummeliibacillus stabekisii]MCM3317183.1 MAE_28990/MAE_18760 family HEPN-like nuclease [Rummeliibacillus stabekisii]